MSTSRAFIIALLCAGCADEPPATAGISCTTPAIAASLPADIREASGVAFSADDPSLLWVHNDSDASPAFHALRTDGSVRARFPIPGARARDWEDLAVGPCPSGHCLYIGDIGDNLHQRNDPAILRLREPAVDHAMAPSPERFPFRYPNGPEDAEAMFIMPDTSIYVISKGRSDPVTVYRYPPPLRAGETVLLEQVQQLTPGLVQLPDFITGAAARPDGAVIAVRTYSRLRFYRFQDARLVPLAPDSGFDLTHLDEPQGEGVALRQDGTIYLVSESGLEGRPAPLSSMTCRLP